MLWVRIPALTGSRKCCILLGASLADIFRAAGWATPNTFARFYSLRVEPVFSCVLTSNGLEALRGSGFRSAC